MRIALAMLILVTGCHGIRSVTPHALMAHAAVLSGGVAATVDDVTIEPFQDVEVVYADGRTHHIGVAQLLHDCATGEETQTGCALAGSTRVIVQRGNEGRVAVFVAIVVAVVAATVGFGLSGDAP